MYSNRLFSEPQFLCSKGFNQLYVTLARDTLSISVTVDAVAGTTLDRERDALDGDESYMKDLQYSKVLTILTAFPD